MARRSSFRNAWRDPGAVVVGGRLPALSTVRALGRHGVSVAVVATQAEHIAQYSRWAAERHALLEFPARPEALLELLDRQRERWRGSAVFATDDQTLETLSRHRAALVAFGYRVIAPAFDVTRQLLRKDLLHRVAREQGVDLPRTYGPASPGVAARPDLRFPVVIKPDESYRFVRRFGRKLLLARDRSELSAAVEATEAAGLTAEVLEYVPGPDSQFYNYSVYLGRGGRVLAEVGMHKLRKSPPFFGVCRVGEIADVPALRDPTLRILRRIGWEGVANAEFKLDPRDGRFRLMEINGRCFLMQGLALAAGVDYSSLAWDEAVQGEAGPLTAKPWDGVWINGIDDLYHMLMFRRLEGLGLREYLAPWRRRKAFAIWCRGDPRPFLAHVAFGLRKAARMILRADYRRAVVARVQATEIAASRT